MDIYTYIYPSLFYSPRTQAHHCSRTTQKSTPNVSSASEGKFLKLWASKVKIGKKARYIGGTMVKKKRTVNMPILKGTIGKTGRTDGMQEQNK